MKMRQLLTILAIALASSPALADITTQPMSCATASERFHCKGVIRTDLPRFTPLAGATPTGYGPADLASAYGLNSALKPAATIAIVDAFGYPNAESDLAAYRTKYGLPPCTVANGCLTVVNQLCAASPLPPPPPANDDWTVETALDLDMASAACPSCKLLLIQAQDDVSDGLMQAQATAAKLGANVISDSWGSAETAQRTGLSQETFFNLGKPIAIFIAAGDSGYDNAGQGPDYPSTSQYVIAVGGTTLIKAAGTTRGWTETAWSTKAGTTGAGGSSCSLSVAKPAWQQNLMTSCTLRAASDVAAVGDPATGLAVYNAGAGGWIVVGGTSAAAPFVAGVFALYSLGTVAPSYPYTHLSAFNDVLSGTNGACGNVLCNAGKGWDGPTGVGTPNGVVLGGGSVVTPPPDMAMPPATGGGNGNSGGGSAANGNGGSGGTAADTSGNGKMSNGFYGGCSLGLGAPATGGAGLAWLALAFFVARRRRRSR
jgi:subtilase family serine protease